MTTAETDDRRGAARILRREEVSIQILLSCPDGSCPAQVVTSETVDVSRCGLRLRLPLPVPEQRILDLCVELQDDPCRYLLTGETRWCHPTPEGDGHEVGITILDGEGTDYSHWARNFDPPEPE